MPERKALVGSSAPSKGQCRLEKAENGSSLPSCFSEQEVHGHLRVCSAWASGGGQKVAIRLKFLSCFLCSAVMCSLQLLI